MSAITVMNFRLLIPEYEDQALYATRHLSVVGLPSLGYGYWQLQRKYRPTLGMDSYSFYHVHDRAWRRVAAWHATPRPIKTKNPARNGEYRRTTPMVINKGAFERYVWIEYDEHGLPNPRHCSPSEYHEVAQLLGPVPEREDVQL